VERWCLELTAISSKINAIAFHKNSIGSFIVPVSKTSFKKMVWCCVAEPLGPEESAHLDILDDKYRGQRLAVGKSGIQPIPSNSAKPDPYDSLVSVTCPAGVRPGQMLQVNSLDGTRAVHALVPEGVRPGQTFIVEFPPQKVFERVMQAEPVKPPPSFENSLDDWLTSEAQVPVATEQRNEETHGTLQPVPAWVAPSSAAPKRNEKGEAREPPVSPKLPENPVQSFLEQIEDFLAPTPDVVPAPMPKKSMARTKEGKKGTTRERKRPEVLARKDAVESRRQPSPPQSEAQQKLLLVHIPPGLTAGSFMQVEIPGEHRALMITVPPNTTSFHVAYTPLQAPPMTSAISRTSATSHTPVTPQPVPANQKLLLVRVPSGTSAGTLMHVSVPDEPGRILAAQVPAGNVTEFHVSYEPHPRVDSHGMSSQAAGSRKSGNPFDTPSERDHQHRQYQQREKKSGRSN
jgi:hypothetical protein